MSGQIVGTSQCQLHSRDIRMVNWSVSFEVLRSVQRRSQKNEAGDAEAILFGRERSCLLYLVPRVNSYASHAIHMM
jgi:hypothetical protein